LTPRIGTPRQFTAVRNLLQESGYAGPAIRERLGIRRLSESRNMHSRDPASDTLGLLIQLFLLGEPAAEATVSTQLRQADLDALFELRLLQQQNGVVTATVALYPTHSVYIVSDRDDSPPIDDAGRAMPKVFSAISPQTEEFLDFLPGEPCPAFLELCAGAGAAAIVAASRYAVHSFAFDISERARCFAEFNGRLNGLSNLTVRQGDLYAPAGRQTFDRIVAHPPYMPALRQAEMFRDGGEDGEVLTRRIVEGLPNYLHPGGRFYCLAMVPGVAEDPFEARVRRWLRESQSEFDVVVVIRKQVEAPRFIFENLTPGAVRPGDIELWQTVLRHRRIEAFAHVSLFIARRRGNAVPALTVVRDAGDGAEARVEELLRHERAAKTEGLEQWILALRPVANPDVQMRVSQELRRGAWEARSFAYSVERPFRAGYEGPKWIGDFLSRCDGTLSCGEHIAALRHEGLTGDDPAAFLRVVRELIGRGLLCLSEAEWNTLSGSRTQTE
jgi:SAM-dependent methyltransferase